MKIKKNKKKKVQGGYLTFTTGDLDLNMKRFNQAMGTAGLQNPNSQHLVVGDVTPNGPVASSSDGASDAGNSSAGEGGAMGESLTEDKDFEIQIQNNENIIEDEKELNPPIDLEYFPNNMGINLCSVKSEKWTEQDDGQLKKVEIEFDPATPEEIEAQGGLNSDFWDDEEVKESLTEAKNEEMYMVAALYGDGGGNQIYYIGYDYKAALKEYKKDAKDWVNYGLGGGDTAVALIQYNGDKAPFDKAIAAYIEENGHICFYDYFNENDCDILDETWDEIEENLTEAHLDYYTQKEKMRQLNNGTRKFNAAAASDEKLKFNRNVCQQEGYPIALKIVEDEMIRRGLISRKRDCDKQIKLTIDEIKPEDAQGISGKLDKGLVWRHAIKYLLFALYGGNNALADKIKDTILDTFKLTVNELVQIVERHLSDTDLVNLIQKICSSTKIESLTEDKFYSHREESDFELPPEIHLVDQNKVEDFIQQVSPEEEFTVGYATPIYFYKELDNLFTLVKATELVGYTGLDYRDAIADPNISDHDERIANAQRQIATYTDGATGHKLNKEGEKFSTPYRQTNKLALNPEKSNQRIEYEYELDDNGNPVLDQWGNPVAKKDADNKPIIKSTIDLSKILFYPRVGSKPKVIYYLDLKDGNGYQKFKRGDIIEALYRKVQEMAFAKDNALSSADSKRVQKYGFKDLLDFHNQFPQLSFDDFLDALKKGIDPKDYLKTYPFSRRWTMQMFSEKVQKMLDQDSKTIEAVGLDATQGYDRQVEFKELKPQVRALYTNQVYYISGKPGTLGSVLSESLEGEQLSLNDWFGEEYDNYVNKNEDLTEAKRYVKRYYVRPQNIFCSNKEDILKALLRVNGENCSIYSLKDLPDHDDVQELKPSDIIYYYDDGILYDKNHVKVMDYDLNVKHEEERKKFADVDTAPTAQVNDAYDDRLTDADLKDKEAVANFKAINQRQMK